MLDRVASSYSGDLEKSETVRVVLSSALGNGFEEFESCLQETNSKKLTAIRDKLNTFIC